MRQPPQPTDRPDGEPPGPATADAPGATAPTGLLGAPTVLPVRRLGGAYVLDEPIGAGARAFYVVADGAVTVHDAAGEAVGTVTDAPERGSWVVSGDISPEDLLALLGTRPGQYDVAVAGEGAPVEVALRRSEGCSASDPGDVPLALRRPPRVRPASSRPAASSTTAASSSPPTSRAAAPARPASTSSPSTSRTAAPSGAPPVPSSASPPRPGGTPATPRARPASSSRTRTATSSSSDWPRSEVQRGAPWARVAAVPDAGLALAGARTESDRAGAPRPALSPPARPPTRARRPPATRGRARSPCADPRAPP